MQSDLTIGIVTGIISSGIFALLVYVVKYYLIPKLSDLAYKTPAISGEWRVIHPTDENDAVGTAIIKQSGASVKITIKIHKRKNGEASNRVFVNKGQFRSGQIVTTFEEPKNKAYNIGALILKLSSNGKELKGCTTYFHHDSGQMVTNNWLLRRNGE